MSGIKFSHYTDSSTLARDSQATLAEQRSVFISADMERDRIDLSVADEGHSSFIRFTTEQARAIATEMLACADARDAAHSTKPGQEG